MKIRRWFRQSAVPLALAAFAAMCAAGQAAHAASASATVPTFTVVLTDLAPADGIAPAIAFHYNVAYQYFMVNDASHPFQSTSAFGYTTLQTTQAFGELRTQTGPELASTALASHAAATQLEAQATSRLYFDLTPNTAVAFHLPYTLERASAPGDTGTAGVFMLGEGAGLGEFSMGDQLNGRTLAKTGTLTGVLASGAASAAGEFGFAAYSAISVVPEPERAGMLLAGLVLLGALQYRQRRQD